MRYLRALIAYIRLLLRQLTAADKRRDRPKPVTDMVVEVIE